MPNLNYGEKAFDITDVKSDVDVNLRNKIKAMLIENPKVTQKQMVDKLDVSYRKIQQNMADMSVNGEIVRIGSRRAGHWEVLEK